MRWGVAKLFVVFTCFHLLIMMGQEILRNQKIWSQCWDTGLQSFDFFCRFLPKRVRNWVKLGEIFWIIFLRIDVFMQIFCSSKDFAGTHILGFSTFSLLHNYWAIMMEIVQFLKKIGFKIWRFAGCGMAGLAHFPWD